MKKRFLTYDKENAGEVIENGVLDTSTLYGEYTAKTDFVINGSITEELASSDILPNIGENYPVIVNGQKQMFTVQGIEIDGISGKSVGTVDFIELMSGQSKGWTIVSNLDGTMLLGYVENETVITIDAKKIKQIDAKYLPINAPWKGYRGYKNVDDYKIFMLNGCTVEDLKYRPLIVYSGQLYVSFGNGSKYVKYTLIDTVVLGDGTSVAKIYYYVFIDSEDGYTEFCENHGITVE